MELHRIGVISDTHGMLRPEVLDALQGCKAILHGGDIVDQDILERLGKIAPVYAVRGNVDKEGWARELPETLKVTLFGIRFFLIHNKKQISSGPEDVDVVICGHSHKYEEKHSDGMLWLNPGSCGPRRFLSPVTMAILEIGEDGGVKVEKRELLKDDPGRQAPDNIHQIIESAMRDVSRGRTVEEIARKNGIDKGLAEQICRLYLTHPGVDADGIMAKMGL